MSFLCTCEGLGLPCQLLLPKATVFRSSSHGWCDGPLPHEAMGSSEPAPPWSPVPRHARFGKGARPRAPSWSCQHVNLLNTSAKIATNMVVGMVWMYFGCGHFYFSSCHSIYGRQNPKETMFAKAPSCWDMLRQGCFTKTPNESATGLHLHGDKAWKCSVCIPTTQRRKRQIAVLAWKTWGGNVVAKANLLCPCFFLPMIFYHHVGYKYNYIQYIHAKKLFRQEKTNSVGGRKPK